MLAQSCGAFRSTTGTASPPATEKFPTSANKSAARRILVVDDEPLVRWAVAETLRTSGYEVAQAGDAKGAVRALSDGPPDLMLLDLRLPDSTDLRLLETVRRLAPELPVVLMTAFGTAELHAAAIGLGAVCVLDKPFNVHDLGDMIARLIRPPH